LRDVGVAITSRRLVETSDLKVAPLLSIDGAFVTTSSQRLTLGAACGKNVNVGYGNSGDDDGVYAMSIVVKHFGSPCSDAFEF